MMISRCSNCFAELTGDPSCPWCARHGQARPSPLALPVGTLLAGQYCIGQVLGKPGGFGITYLAWDEKLETRVAIKEFFPAQMVGRGTDRATLLPHSEEHETLFEYGLNQFLEEARRLAKFDHPNIVRVRTFFQANGTGYLVMDYYEGQSLAAFLAKQPGERLGERLAVEIMIPVLDGLRAVHAKGMLHRDIDPHNLYLTTQGRVILLDFGAARTAVGDKSRSLSVILKPGYAPYEQYSSSGKQGPWTDVYACAATLYRIVTGEIPPDAPSRIMGDVLRPAHELNPQVSQRLGEVLQQALALRPEERPQTAEEFLQLLLKEPVPRHEPQLEMPVRTTPPQERPKQVPTDAATITPHPLEGRRQTSGATPAAAPSAWQVVRTPMFVAIGLIMGATTFLGSRESSVEPLQETAPWQISASSFFYPEELWDAGIEGSTVLRIFITEAGRVDTVRVEQSSGYAAFDSAAVMGAYDLRFEPARRGGEPLATWILLPVDFDKR